MHKQRFPTPCDSSEDSCSSTYYLSVNEVQEEVSCRACRVCWDSSDTDKLVAPCSCKGNIHCILRYLDVYSYFNQLHCSPLRSFLVPKPTKMSPRLWVLTHVNPTHTHCPTVSHRRHPEVRARKMPEEMAGKRAETRPPRR